MNNKLFSTKISRKSVRWNSFREIRSTKEIDRHSGGSGNLLNPPTDRTRQQESVAAVEKKPILVNSARQGMQPAINVERRDITAHSAIPNRLQISPQNQPFTHQWVRKTQITMIQHTLTQ